MTDAAPTAAALLPILRAGIRDGNYELGDHPAIMDAEDAMKDAADHIEAQAAEIERLRAVLEILADEDNWYAEGDDMVTAWQGEGEPDEIALAALRLS
jgi:hypothetical protein